MALFMRTRRQIEQLNVSRPGDQPGRAFGTMKKWTSVPGDTAPTHTNWREWANRIQQESDPQKVFALARQLFAEFDDEQAHKSLPPKAE
jgi:hypothetical protein